MKWHENIIFNINGYFYCFNNKYYIIVGTYFIYLMQNNCFSYTCIVYTVFKLEQFKFYDKIINFKQSKL